MAGLRVDTEPSKLCISGCHDILCHPTEEIQVRIRGCAGEENAPHLCPKLDPAMGKFLCQVLGTRCPQLPIKS